jgi:hypothetical protein
MPSHPRLRVHLDDSFFAREAEAVSVSPQVATCKTPHITVPLCTPPLPVYRMPSHPRLRAHLDEVKQKLSEAEGRVLAAETYLSDADLVADCLSFYK